MLERVLRAADYRPSLPLADYADQITAIAARRGIERVRVFGSTVHGEDHFDSDIDLLVSPGPRVDLFDLALFAEEVRALTGFPVDVVTDTAVSAGMPLRSSDRELQRILHRCESVIEAGRESFAEGAPHYDVASMVVIRLAALLERPEFANLAERLTPDEITAIKATRNIASHAGYVGMNDDLFWAAVTVRIPEIVTRLLDSASP